MFRTAKSIMALDFTCRLLESEDVDAEFAYICEHVFDPRAYAHLQITSGVGAVRLNWSPGDEPSDPFECVLELFSNLLISESHAER